MLLLTYRQPPLLTYQPKAAPKRVVSKHRAATIARLKAEGALERRSYELTAATGRPHCRRCTAMLAPGGWHCASCKHVTDPDRLMEIYISTAPDPLRDPLPPGPGIFSTARANFWIPGVHGTVYVFMSARQEDDRHEMPFVAVCGPFVRKADAERLRQKLHAIWQFEPSVNLADPETWPDNPQAHPRVRRAVIVWAVEKWLAPTHARH